MSKKSNKQAWMIRAGDFNELIEDFEKKGVVAVGWHQMGNLKNIRTRDEMKDIYRTAYPEYSDARVNVNSGQIFRFVNEINEGDYVLTYNKSNREYIIGKIASSYIYDKRLISDGYPHVRKVKWDKRILRDDFSSTVKNSLGSALTIFTVTDHIAEIDSLLEGKKVSEDEQEPLSLLYDNVKSQADERISDIISNIDPYAFQNLVAAVLRAMGFKTTVSTPGPDRGVDIMAHPDPFGFETPRIKVQVKHRAGSSGGGEIRQLKGTIKKNEKGLFVSTGGFSKEAFNEVRGEPDVKLMDINDFINLMIEHYEKMEPEYQALVPLKKVFIPISEK